MNDRWDEARRAFPPPRLLEKPSWLGQLFATLLGTGARGAVFVSCLFSLYYLVTNVVGCALGVGLAEPGARRLVSLGFPGWITQAARHGPTVAAFEDLVHAIFSVSVIFFGGLFAAAYLRTVPKAFSLLAFDSGLQPSPGDYRNATAEITKRMSKVLFFVPPAVGAVAALLSFLWLEHLPQLSPWWAHAVHGPAGVLLAINIAVVIGLGTLLCEVMVVLTLALYRLFQSPIRLRPLHQDGCGGFAPLGVVFVLVYCIMLCGAVGFAAVYWFGYFGLERTPLYWGCVLLYLLAVFIVVFAPLIWFAAKVESEKRRVLRNLESQFHRAFPREAAADSLDRGVPPIQDLLMLYEAYSRHPVSPLAGRTLMTLVGSYALQVVVGLYGFLKG